MLGRWGGRRDIGARCYRPKWTSGSLPSRLSFLNPPDPRHVLQHLVHGPSTTHSTKYVAAGEWSPPLAALVTACVSLSVMWGALLLVLPLSPPSTLVFLLLSPKSLASQEPQCSLPKAWEGAWFLSGRQERILITSRILGWLGACHVHRGDNKYVLHRSRDRCYQCVAIWPRHANALQFKAGDCNPNDSDLEQLCNISPDVTLNTLVRLDSKPIDCPFQGPVSFSYNKGTGLCSSPLSELLPCMTPGQLKLRFHACPDIQQTESRGEELLPAKPCQ